jgi:DNA-binding NarL/FixJ family response regulator
MSMSVDEVPPLVDRSLLMLVDENAAFRLGLRVCLEQYSDLELAVEDADGSIAIQMLESARGFSADISTASEGIARPLESPDLPSIEAIALIILDIELGRSNPAQVQGLSLCQRIKGQYPQLPVLLITSAPSPAQVNAAHQAGANGYCSKTLGYESLVVISRRVASGQNYWMPLTPAILEPRQPSARVVTSAPGKVTRPGVWKSLRSQLHQSSIRQIDAVVDDIVNELENGDLSLLDRAIVAGRYRELQAARWLVTRLLVPNRAAQEPVENEYRFTDDSLNDAALFETPVRGRGAAKLRNRRVSQPPVPPGSNLPGSTLTDASSAIVIQSSSFVEQVRDLRSILFDSISTKLQNSLENLTETPLEIDVLREDKKRELLYLVLRKIEELLGELTYSQVQAVQLNQKQPDILQDLWQAIATEFFGKYYTVSVAGRSVEVVDTLLQDGDLIQTAILEKIPSVSELLRHLLFQAPLEIDSALYPVGNPESLARAESLLENWMIQMANAVMQPLLNRFANVEVIKQTFYDRRLLSIRDIERFRNNLSWRYRLEQFLREPTDIFESKHQLWILSGRGIRRTSVYAIRYPELEQLEGIPRAITLVLEARDAIAPRLRSAVSLVGNGLIYVLTDVIGRGIGLVGRGVLKGIGNAWQDNRFSRK